MSRIILLLLIFISTTDIYANEEDATQTPDEETSETNLKSDSEKLTAKEERAKVKFRFIPGPTYDPSIGFGLMLIPMFVYYPDKDDMISPPSQTSAFYMVTSNKSMMGGITQKFYLKRDTWRIDFGGYAGRLNMDVDVKNTQGAFLKSVATSRKFRFLKLYVDRRVYKDLFFGLGVKGMKSWFEAQNTSNEALIETAFGGEGGYQWGGIARTFLDKRDNIFYPYKGMYLSYTFDYNAETDDFNAYSGNQYDIRYFKMLSSFRHIMAFHAYGKILSKSAPSNVLQFYGRAVNSTQRGFVTGEFYDRNIFSSDVEYRYILPVLNDKIGTAVFANFGKVYGNDNEFSDADWLVGGGVGLRYFILPYERIHAVLDAAWSKDTFAMYFGLRAPF